MPRWWLGVGPETNWLHALEHGIIWGVKGVGRPALMWETVAPGDRLVFYVTAPIAAVIGYGTIRAKFRQDKPLWPEEVKARKVFWPLRFEFDVDYVLPKDQWRERAVSNSPLRTIARGGFQAMDEELALQLVSQFGQPPEAPAKPLPPSEHARLVEWLVEVGRLQKFIAEKEYRMGAERLDVVWRKVAESVPTFVFEVQIGGDPYHALGKLKHAFDIWNSRIFLVAREQDRAKATTLLSGTFHEIQPHLRFVEVRQVEELLQRKRSFKDLENQLGLV